MPASPFSEPTHIYLVSREAERFSIEKDVAVRQSRLIESLADADSEEVDFPLPTVSTATLAAITAFLNYHKDNEMAEIPQPLRSANLSDSVSQWYVDFIQPNDIERLAEVTAAANFMDIPALLQLSCAAFASVIKHKEKHELRAKFGIADPQLAEQIPEEVMRKENSWAETA